MPTHEVADLSRMRDHSGSRPTSRPTSNPTTPKVKNPLLKPVGVRERVGAVTDGATDHRAL